ncbi:hypothetical protein AKJ62_01105 [candidate division MSBL1 archaeon SCGC-AAA259D14]|uniref:Dinitrogenase iron-molybdenum cofactor biosynthesis domain-containing protein n=2 Tax=candidate division MSBL1 TaxID=215777 RepID=A0A133U817_9EURY|nr:hypothetical protein AKJ61_01505 [candidate division MSBL1 archaeon SCGC-AAA259B11]KXA90351.1 hypothetical protein AKJ62_01105 [candidate division MSBL1 archaeon SCGC-AAA259D14]
MRIAVSADGQRLESQISPVFGRCPFFIVVETEDDEIVEREVLENSAMEQPSGAGTAAVQLVGDKDVDVVISGGIGPKAFSALKQWKIKAFKGEPGPVRYNLDKFLEGELEEVESATGSPGMGRADRK